MFKNFLSFSVVVVFIVVKATIKLTSLTIFKWQFSCGLVPQISRTFSQVDFTAAVITLTFSAC